jgi:hypothetical protein
MSCTRRTAAASEWLRAIARKKAALCMLKVPVLALCCEPSCTSPEAGTVLRLQPAVAGLCLMCLPCKADDRLVAEFGLYPVSFRTRQAPVVVASWIVPPCFALCTATARLPMACRTLPQGAEFGRLGLSSASACFGDSPARELWPYCGLALTGRHNGLTRGSTLGRPGNGACEP